MRTKEVMEMLNISRTTLWRYVNNGLIKKIDLPHGRAVYDRQSVIELHNKLFGSKKSIHIKISVSNKEDITNQSKILKQFCVLNDSTIDDISIEITNKIDIDEFKDFFNELDSIVKNKIDKITITSITNLNEKKLNLIHNLLDKYDCEVAILNKIEFDILDIDKMLDKNSIEFFNIKSIL